VLTGLPLDQYLDERLLGPLGMVDTGISVPATSADGLAACYSLSRGASPEFTLQDAPATSRYLTPATYFSGAGGMVSTADDYMRFCKMLAGRGQLDACSILGSGTLGWMASNHLPEGRDLACMGQPHFTETTMEGIGFGLGFAVLMNPADARVVGTPGEYYWGGAASTAFFVSPAEDLTMVFLTHLLPSSAHPFRRQLRAAIYQAIVD
jgi:CubicO group peptidase (beta-lactamase class C family)